MRKIRLSCRDKYLYIRVWIGRCYRSISILVHPQLGTAKASGFIRVIRKMRNKRAQTKTRITLESVDVTLALVAELMPQSEKPRINCCFNSFC